MPSKLNYKATKQTTIPFHGHGNVLKNRQCHNHSTTEKIEEH